MIELHEYQILILKKLLYQKEAKFSQLNTSKIDNNHFNYHLKYLINEGFISKTDNLYLLTDKGLELANRIDTKESRMTSQPKVSVMIRILNNEGMTLVGYRQKDPEKGKISFYTEKVRLGESIEDTITRCLKNETGLEGTSKFRGVIRNMYYSKQNLVEDTLMICFDVVSTSQDKFIEVSEETTNMWVSNPINLKESELFPEMKKFIKLFESENIFYEQIFQN